MKTLNKVLLATTLTVVATGANASILGANDLTIGSPYVGVKIGAIDFAANTEARELHNQKFKAGNYGIYGGVELFGGMGAEIAYSKSTNADSDNFYLFESGFADFKTVDATADKIDLSVFYKLHPLNNSPLYLKGKVGYSHVKQDTTKYEAFYHSTSVDRENSTKQLSKEFFDDVKGVGYGAAVGYQLTDKIGAELTYEAVRNKGNSKPKALNLGIHYKF